MRITHYNNVDFSIDANGNISRKSTWHVMDDTATAGNWTGLLERVKQWAGEPGEPWKLPGGDSQSFVEDSSFVVSGITFKTVNRFMYEVEFTGVKAHLEALMSGRPRIRVNQSAETEKSAVWKIHADSLEGFLPQVGDVLDWAGELFMCAEIACESSGAGQYEVTLQAKDMSVLMVGNPVFQRGNDLESRKTAKWRVGTDAIDAFIAEHDVNTDASAWAGDGYFVVEVQTEAIGTLGYYVSIEAKHIGVRLIDIKKSEKFNSYDDYGGVQTETVYTGRWQVHADRRQEFDGICGQSADGWSEAGFTVVLVAPVMLSELEYEYTLEARNLENATAGMTFEYDPRENLRNRNDINAFPTEFILTAEQCGWRMHDGRYVKISELDPGAWTPDSDCPFQSSAELSPSLINRTLPTLGLQEIIYLKGNGSKHVHLFANWDASGRIMNAYTIGNYTGSWLKLGQKSSMELDNKGDVWTRISRYYQKAPGNRMWNSAYSGF